MPENRCLNMFKGWCIFPYTKNTRRQMLLVLVPYTLNRYAVTWFKNLCIFIGTVYIGAVA